MKLKPFQEFICVLMKLRLNCPMQDLAYRFKVSVSTISRIFFKWITVMQNRLYHLILRPDRDALMKIIPACYQTSYEKKLQLLLIVLRSSLRDRQICMHVLCTWSSYKHRNTVKVLLGTPSQGMISFLSDTWRGRRSDKLSQSIVEY